jgi:hypothetical protein
MCQHLKALQREKDASRRECCHLMRQLAHTKTANKAIVEGLQVIHALVQGTSFRKYDWQFYLSILILLKYVLII